MTIKHLNRYNLHWMESFRYLHLFFLVWKTELNTNSTYKVHLGRLFFIDRWKNKTLFHMKTKWKFILYINLFVSVLWIHRRCDPSANINLLFNRQHSSSFGRFSYWMISSQLFWPLNRFECGEWSIELDEIYPKLTDFIVCSSFNKIEPFLRTSEILPSRNLFSVYKAAIHVAFIRLNENHLNRNRMNKILTEHNDLLHECPERPTTNHQLSYVHKRCEN